MTTNGKRPPAELDQTPAKPEVPLTADEELAVERFVSGGSPTEIAAELGVSRRQVLAWFKKPRFVAAVEQYREPMRAATRNVLEAAAIDAAETLRRAITSDDLAVAVKASLAVLRGIGAIDDDRASQPSVSELLAEVRAQALRQRQLELRDAVLDSSQAPVIIDVDAECATDDELEAPNVPTSQEIAGTGDTTADDSATGAPSQEDEPHLGGGPPPGSFPGAEAHAPPSKTGGATQSDPSNGHRRIRSIRRGEASILGGPESLGDFADSDAS